jgi:hypothetical protein
MADNVELNAGNGGASLAADDIGGVHHQRVKVQHGADGSATDVSTASPLPVDLRADNIAGAGLKVDLGADNDVTVTGTVTANAGTNLNTSALALESGGNLATLAGAVDGTEMQVDVVSSTLPSGAATAANQSTVIGHLDGVEALLGTIDADTSTLAGAVDGNEVQVDVVGALPAGTNLIGNVGVGVRTSGGVTPYKNLDVDESEDEVKGSPGQVYLIHAMNLANAKRYLKFYNETAANVAVGTTTPVLTFPLPTQGDTNGAGFTLTIPNGIAFSTAITIAATTGFADNDTGAPGANEVIVNLGYA